MLLLSRGSQNRTELFDRLEVFHLRSGFRCRSDDERKWLYGKLGREPETADFDTMSSLIENCGRVIGNKRGVPRFLNPLFPGE